MHTCIHACIKTLPHLLSHSDSHSLYWPKFSGVPLGEEGSFMAFYGSAGHEGLSFQSEMCHSDFLLGSLQDEGNPMFLQ